MKCKYCNADMVEVDVVSGGYYDGIEFLCTNKDCHSTVIVWDDHLSSVTWYEKTTFKSE